MQVYCIDINVPCVVSLAGAPQRPSFLQRVSNATSGSVALNKQRFYLWLICCSLLLLFVFIAPPFGSRWILPVDRVLLLHNAEELLIVLHFVKALIELRSVNRKDHLWIYFLGMVISSMLSSGILGLPKSFRVESLIVFIHLDIYTTLYCMLGGHQHQ
jgi:hypothetical protein